MSERYMTAATELELINLQSRRLNDLLGRFCRSEDNSLSDRDLILKVFGRWKRESDSEVGDVGDGVDMSGILNT